MLCPPLTAAHLFIPAAAPLPRPLPGVGLATSLLNLLVAEPIATDVMFQRYALENAPSRDDGEAAPRGAGRVVALLCMGGSAICGCQRRPTALPGQARVLGARIVCR